MEEDQKIDKHQKDLKIGSSHIFFGMTLFLYGYFFVRMLFFAFHISPLIPPDEIDHFGLCRIFYDSWPMLPKDSPVSYEYGPITHIPCLYYYLMAFFLKLNIIEIDQLIYLRLINTLLAMLSIFFAHRWLRLITYSRTMQILFLVMLTNTPMLGFIGASVNYDNLVNLMAIMAIYYLHAFLASPYWRLLLASGICLLAGNMIKITFLPLGLMLLIILACHAYRYFDEITTAMRQERLGKYPYVNGPLLAVFLLLAIANISLYVGNLWKFGTLMPETKNIVGETNALHYRFAAEKIVLSQYREGSLTFEEAVEKARRHIKRHDDLNRTLFYLEIARDYKLNQRPIMDRISYAEVWCKVMVRNTFGILGHLSMMKPPWQLGIYQMIFLFSILCIVRYWRPTDGEGHLTDALIIAISYTLIIMQYANYNEYTRHLSPDSGIQGRYIFPILPLIYGIMSHYLLKPWQKVWQAIIVVIIGGYFVFGDFPFFLSQATEEWFSR